MSLLKHFFFLIKIKNKIKDVIFFFFLNSNKIETKIFRGPKTPLKNKISLRPGIYKYTDICICIYVLSTELVNYDFLTELPVHQTYTLRLVWALTRSVMVNKFVLLDQL